MRQVGGTTSRLRCFVSVLPESQWAVGSAQWGVRSTAGARTFVVWRGVASWSTDQLTASHGGRAATFRPDAISIPPTPSLRRTRRGGLGNRGRGASGPAQAASVSYAKGTIKYTA